MSKTLLEKIEAIPRFAVPRSLDDMVPLSEVLRIVAEHDQTAPRTAWKCVPCDIEVHLGETFGDCPKCSKPMVCND